MNTHFLIKKKYRPVYNIITKIETRSVHMNNSINSNNN